MLLSPSSHHHHCGCLVSRQGWVGIVVTTASCKVVRMRERREEWVLVLRLLATWYCIGIMSRCEDEEVGAAMVVSHESLRSCQHCIQVIWFAVAAHPHLRVVGEWEGREREASSFSSRPHHGCSPTPLSSSPVPHALIIPPLLHHCCHCPQDTCLVEASLLSGGVTRASQTAEEGEQRVLPSRT